MKVTSPKDLKITTEDQLEKVLGLFESQWKDEDLSERYFHLVIEGEYPRPVLDEVERIYKEAGWAQVRCRTSSENGERPGLTGLQLTNDPTINIGRDNTIKL